MRILIAETTRGAGDGLLRTLRASGAVWTMWPVAVRPMRRC